MSGRALGKPRDAGVRGGLEACAGKSAELYLQMCSNACKRGARWRSAEQTSLASCFERTRPAVLSLEERRSEVKRFMLGVHGYRPCANVRGDPRCLTVVVVAPGGGRGPTPLRCHPRKTGA